ncbi:BapA/Bap/LapF family large adhesin, partial [Sphingomonas sp.]|uniref:BapA/Bap/LapF family large adhesin n=1 Tax=Sphingomonas sp. TaxID=28214 RepID=UPI002602DFB4
NGEALTVTQADAANNVSPAITLTAPDFTAPGAPAATVAPDGASVTGTGEPGATVTIIDENGRVVGVATVEIDGTYNTPLTPAQIDGAALFVSQRDAAGNVSPSISVATPDLTAPDAPTLGISADGATASGLGEPGARLSITDAAGTVVGTTTVAANGTFVATLSPVQNNGQVLSAVQTDAAGNFSAPATVTAPDLVTPAAPNLAINADGTIATGLGEADARLVITNAAGDVVGAGIVAADGSFAIALSPPQRNGELLSATQTDAAGNRSPAVTANAPDITPPAVPTGAISGDGTQLIGRGEAGATVTVTSTAGAPLGSAVVQADGSYTVTLTPAQGNGETVRIVQTDVAGNASPAASALAPDITAPGAPGVAVATDGTSVTGTGEPGAAIVIRTAGGVQVGSTTVAADGTWSAVLAPPQANGGSLSVVQTDAAGNTSPATVAPAPDITPPLAPQAAVSGDGTAITGSGEPGTTVTVTTATGTPLGSGTVNADGSFSVPLTPAQANGEQVRVTLADAAGNASPATPVRAPDITPPGAPSAGVSPDGTQVTGRGEPGATVTVSGADGVLGTAVVRANGSYSVTLSTAQTNGETLSVTQRDAAGNASAPTSVLAPDGTAPDVPTAAVTPDGLTVVGTGVAGSTITVTDSTGAVIGTASVLGDGSYTAVLTTPQRNGEQLNVTQADGSGNVSPPVPVLAPDITPPAAPTLLVASDGTAVSGTGEIGATVIVRTADGTQVGIATVAADGTYATTLTPPQANGGTLSATQADATGNISPPITANAPDITPPPAPTGVTITADGATVNGNGEAGASVTVRGPGNTVLGTGTVAADGSFSVTLTSAQVTGATLSVSLADAAGNQSPAVPLIAPFDIIAFNNTDTVPIDLLPVTSDVDFGSANYVALVSLGLLNLDAAVLGTPSVAFTVDPGHSFDATFTYDALLSLGVISGYSVVVQRFDGRNWVAADGNGSASLLQLSLLGGDIVASGTYGPGQYRAFLTFQGTLGVGVLGSLSVEGVDSDFTQIGGIVAGTATGNVITDPGASGEVDIVSPQTAVTSVTVNGATTAVAADGTRVDGAFGTLIINRDGSYSYTPTAAASAIGQTERIVYTLLDPSDGETESATLSIAITSADIPAAPVATNDTDTATVTYRNVETTVPSALEFSFNTPLGLVIAPATRSGSDSFTVGANTVSDVTITAVRTGLLSVLPTYTITVTDAATNAVVRTVSQTAVAGLPLGLGVTTTLNDLPAGTYNYTVSTTNVLGTAYNTSVYVGQTITYLNDFVVATTGTAEGSLLANDAAGTAFVTLRVDGGGGFVEVSDGGAQIAGRFGTLTIDEAGNYVYQPSSSLAYSASDLVDSFTYQIVQPNGAVATATLSVTIDVPGDGLSAQGAPVEAIVLDAFDLGDNDAVLAGAGEEADFSDLVLLEDPGEIEAVLADYLRGTDPEAADTLVAEPAAAPLGTLDPAFGSGDPMAYLVLAEDLERNRPQEHSQF